MIYHEHMSYYSLKTLIRFLKKFEMEIFDLKFIKEVRSGSVRFYARNIGQRSEKISSAVKNMINYEEELAIAPYDNAFTTNLADGVPLISNSHPCLNAPGTLNDNLTTGALSPDTIKAAVKLFSQFKNHAGKPMRAWANQILTHEYNMIEIEEIFNSVLKPYEESNTKNTLPKLRPAYSRWLTSLTAWFLRDTEYEHAIIQFYKGYRNKMDWREEFLTKNLQGTCYTLGESGTRPLGGVGIVGSTGT